MKIEILYPEVCCLYGDKANMMYLRKCLPQAEFITTSLTQTPRFVQEDVDMIYLCSMSEKSQELLIDILYPYKDRIARLMDECKTLFLLTGNSLEIFGKYIQREDSTKKDGLGLFNIHTIRQSPKRFNSLVLGEFEDMKIVGYVSRFSQSYGENEDSYMIKVIKGCGMNPKSHLEGIHFGKVYGTYLLGPLLIANPDFTKYILSQLGAPQTKLPFEEELYLAYDKKLSEYEKPGLKLE